MKNIRSYVDTRNLQTNIPDVRINVRIWDSETKAIVLFVISYKKFIYLQSFGLLMPFVTYMAVVVSAQLEIP